MATHTAPNVDRVRDLMKKIGFAMLVTRDGDKLRARPMSACLERGSNAIFFLTDARRHKDEEIARNPNVNVSFADAGEQKYVSVTGHCRGFQRPRQDQAVVLDASESVVGELVTESPAEAGLSLTSRYCHVWLSYHSLTSFFA